ncbi:MAG TPA: Type 1 glutamine amidotransferase-like domain-containing protein [Ktedonobacterales bacterium]|nr:Type 1 glutamine amidotransferase-like domain-containing protein [Ktedonobacterales bacterium]
MEKQAHPSFSEQPVAADTAEQKSSEPRGYLLLGGGAEFGGQMALADRRAIDLAGGFDAPLCIVPTAAAPDQNHQRAGANGERWFRSLGAKQVTVVPLIDQASANEAAIANILRHSRLIYLLGGFTGYLAQTLAGSASWAAILDAYAAGAVIAGSSAGAMVLCQYYFDPARKQVAPGLGLLPNACVLPHYNTFGKGWVARLLAALPEAVLVGIDERTGLLDDGPQGRQTGWRVYGQGKVTLYHQDTPAIYPSGASFTERWTPHRRSEET